MSFAVALSMVEQAAKPLARPVRVSFTSSSACCQCSGNEVADTIYSLLWLFSQYSVPQKVWVLDATPGKVRAGGDGEDHPAELIEFLRRMPTQVDL